MLLTITTTHRPATDLGFLLHKNPSRAQTFDLSVGAAHVVYPEATEDRCTAAQLLDVDPVGLVRGKHRSKGPLDQYVNDRPYVASSFLSVAIAQVYGSALSGKSRERAELARTAIPLVARISALPSGGGEEMIRRLFEPLGYEMSVQGHALDPAFPSWGESRYHTVTLTATKPLADLLRHLYVLIPVLDNAKHYFVGVDEIDKLVSKGEDWLPQHPERDLIARRYLRHRHSLAREALARLVEEESVADAEAQQEPPEVVEERVRLNDLRLGSVAAALRGSGARKVLDLGCGEGRLLKLLFPDRQFEEIVGMDVSIRSLEIAKERLRLDEMPDRQRERIRLLHGSLMYRDRRLEGFDAAAVVEVVEHLDPPRLRAFERVLFEFARPATVVLTTPNREYNPRYEWLEPGSLRHWDHRFEWTRAEFRDWAEAVAGRFGYAVRFLPVGQESPDHGAPTQMGIFDRE